MTTNDHDAHLALSAARCTCASEYGACADLTRWAGASLRLWAALALVAGVGLIVWGVRLGGAA